MTTLEVLATSVRQEKEVKCIKTGKKERKQFLLGNYMNVYTDIPKQTTKVLLELISDFSMVTGCKINTQKKNYIFI